MPTTDGVPPEPRLQPNIDGILKLLAPGGELENAAKAVREKQSTEGHIFKRIEKDLQGNRAAVSDIRKMMKMSADKRADYLRTLEPLMVHYGYTLDDIEPDLVQQAQTIKPDPDAEKTDDTDEGAGGKDASDPEPNGDNSVLSGLDKARAHLTGDTKQTAAEADSFVKKAGAPAVRKPKLGIVPPASADKVVH